MLPVPNLLDVLRHIEYRFDRLRGQTPMLASGYSNRVEDRLRSGAPSRQAATDAPRRRRFFRAGIASYRIPGRLAAAGVVVVLAGCATNGAAPSDTTREAFLDCLTNYIVASRITNATPTLSEAVSDPFCATQERAYRTRVMLAASRVSPTGQRETADVVIRHAWEEMVR